MPTEHNDWPALPFDEWKNTCEALHLWKQIIGKYRLSHTPRINHSLHATLYVTPRGLTSGPVPDRNTSISVSLDFIDHKLIVEAASGMRVIKDLVAMSVANFHNLVRTAVERVGRTFNIHGTPNEIRCRRTDVLFIQLSLAGHFQEAAGCSRRSQLG